MGVRVDLRERAPLVVFNCDPHWPLWTDFAFRAHLPGNASSHCMHMHTYIPEREREPRVIIRDHTMQPHQRFGGVLSISTGGLRRLNKQQTYWISCRFQRSHAFIDIFSTVEFSRKSRYAFSTTPQTAAFFFIMCE